MNLSKKIEDYMYREGEKLPDEALALLIEANDVLDSYRFVTSRLLKEGSYEMQMLEQWAPQHHAHIVGDS